MDNDFEKTLCFTVVLVVLGILFCIECQQILVSPISDKPRLRYKFLTFFVIIIDIIIAIIYQIVTKLDSNDNDSNNKNSNSPNDLIDIYVIIMRCLLAINLIIGTFLFWAFGQTSLDALYRSKTAGKKDSPLWVQYLFQFLMISNVLFIIATLIVSFFTKILYTLWLYYLGLNLCLLFIGVLFIILLLRLRFELSNIISRFERAAATQQQTLNKANSTSFESTDYRNKRLKHNNNNNNKKDSIATNNDNSMANNTGSNGIITIPKSIKYMLNLHQFGNKNNTNQDDSSSSDIDDEENESVEEIQAPKGELELIAEAAPHSPNSANSPFGIGGISGNSGGTPNSNNNKNKKSSKKNRNKSHKNKKDNGSNSNSNESNVSNTGNSNNSSDGSGSKRPLTHTHNNDNINNNIVVNNSNNMKQNQIPNNANKKRNGKYKHGYKDNNNIDPFDAIKRQRKNISKMKTARCKTDIAIIFSLIALGVTGLFEYRLYVTNWSKDSVYKIPFSSLEEYIFHFSFLIFYVCAAISWLWVSTKFCKLNKIERNSIFIKYIYVPIVSKWQNMDDEELDKKLKQDIKSKRIKKKIVNENKSHNIDMTNNNNNNHGNYQSRHHKSYHSNQNHNSTSKRLIESDNESNGNTPNTPNHIDMNGINNVNRNEEEEKRKHRRNYRTKSDLKSSDINGSVEATSPSQPNVSVVVKPASVTQNPPYASQPNVSVTLKSFKNRSNLTNPTLNAHIIPSASTVSGDATVIDNDNNNNNINTTELKDSPQHKHKRHRYRGNSHSNNNNNNNNNNHLPETHLQRQTSNSGNGRIIPKQPGSRNGTFGSIDARPMHHHSHLRSPMSAHNSFAMESISAITTTVKHSPNVSLEITTDTLLTVEPFSENINQYNYSGDDMSIVDDISLAKNRNNKDSNAGLIQTDIDGKNLSLNRISSQGKEIGRRGGNKVQKVIVEDDNMRQSIKEKSKMSIIKHKEKFGKHSKTEKIHNRKDTWGSIKNPSYSITAMTMSDDKSHDNNNNHNHNNNNYNKSKPHRNNNGNNNNNNNNSNNSDTSNDKSGLQDIAEMDENGNDTDSKSNNMDNNDRQFEEEMEDISLVIYEFEHVLATMPEKYNHMDFNYLQQIDDYQLAMTFGGPDRLQDLFNHLYTVCHHNSFSEQFLNNNNNNNNNDDPNGNAMQMQPTQQVAMCFLLTQRYSDVVYRILERVGLIDFFTSTIRGTNQKLSHVIGWDHKLMQENEAKQHLILLKLIMFLKRKHDSVLYVGHNQETIEHLKAINACQTYHVKTKGMTHKDFEYISKHYLKLNIPQQ